MAIRDDATRTARGSRAGLGAPRVINALDYLQGARPHRPLERPAARAQDRRGQLAMVGIEGREVSRP